MTQTIILDGKKLAAQHQERIKKEVDELRAQHNHTPGLATVLVGNDAGSAIYVRNKRKQAEKVGMNSFHYQLADSTSQEELLELIHNLNLDPHVDGILVQMPVPKQINQEAVLMAVDPNKDVDGFHPLNVGKLVTGNAELIACTPRGCLELIKLSGKAIKGSHAVIVNRSPIVGRPLMHLMLQQHATITVCHRYTHDLAYFTKQADILIAATGKPHLFTRDFVKKGAVVIDVGIHRREDGSITGDVDTEGMMGWAHAVSPVPGGVGPMTITMLLDNTLRASQRRFRSE